MRGRLATGQGRGDERRWIENRGSMKEEGGWVVRGRWWGRQRGMVRSDETDEDGR